MKVKRLVRAVIVQVTWAKRAGAGRAQAGGRGSAMPAWYRSALMLARVWVMVPGSQCCPASTRMPAAVPVASVKRP